MFRIDQYEGIRLWLIAHVQTQCKDTAQETGHDETVSELVEKRRNFVWPRVSKETIESSFASADSENNKIGRIGEPAQVVACLLHEVSGHSFFA